MLEEWVTIKDYPDFAVSNFGQIMNTRTHKIRRTFENLRGGVMVPLHNEYGTTNRSVASLVAEHFLRDDRYDQRLVYDRPVHIDGDYTNNRADNLRWRVRERPRFSS